MKKLPIEPTTVYYADVIPGTGKTYWATGRLIRCISKGSGIMLYVAPTHRLLEEMKASILEELPDSADPSKLIHIVSQSPLTQGMQTAAFLKCLLDGGFHPDRTRIEPVSEGTVILCTHETFMMLPPDSNIDADPIQQRIIRREKVSVIFDEARKCIVKEGSFKLPIEVMRHILSTYLIKIPQPGGKFDKLVLIKTVNAKAFDKLCLRATKATRKELEKLKALLKTLQNPNLELYGRFNLHSADRKSKTFSLQTMLIPHIAFSGWKKVVLLSAFFKNSQLYHLLSLGSISQYSKLTNRDVVSLSLEGDRLIKLEDITKQVIDKEQLRKIRNRYKKLTLTYISEDACLNQSVLKQGILLDKKGLERASELTTNYHLFNQNNKQGRGTRKRSLRKLLHQSLANNPPEDVKAVFENIPIHPHIKLTPLMYYVKAALSIARAWKKSPKDKPLLLAINVGAKTTGVSNYWKYEVVPVIEEVAAYVGRKVAEHVPFACHGLNEFASYDMLAFLATLNPHPRTRELFLQLCPNYDATLDYTVEQAIQTAMRISVRDTESTSTPLVILTDRKLAELVHKQLGGLPKIVPPSSIANLPKLYPFYPSPWSGLELDARRSLNRESTAGSRAFNKDRDDYIKSHSKYYKEMNRLAVASTRCKKANKSFTKEARLSEVRAAFAEERRALITEFRLLDHQL